MRIDGSWDWGKLSQFLLEDFAEIFFAFKVPKLAADSNVLAWFPAMDGKFNLKSTSWVDNNTPYRNVLFKNI